MSQQIFRKFSNIKFHEDPSGESRVVPRGQMGGQTDVTKLTVAFQNFANSHKNWYIDWALYYFLHYRWKSERLLCDNDNVMQDFSINCCSSVILIVSYTQEIWFGWMSWLNLLCDRVLYCFEPLVPYENQSLQTVLSICFGHFIEIRSNI